MLFSWIFISCFLQIPILAGSYRSSECLVRMNYRLNGKGNVVIVGFFPAFAAYPLNETTDWRMTKFTRDIMIEFKLRNYQCILAMMFAIEEINSNPYLLSNVSLGFEVNNVPHGQRKTLGKLFGSLSGYDCAMPNYRIASEKNTAAVLTGPSWAISEYIGTLLDLYKFPQLTFGPFDSLLSEQRRFSSLYQVAPKDTSLTVGIVSLMLHFHWIWVGLFIIDDHKGAQTLSDLRSEMDKNGVCTAFVEMIVVTRGSFFTKSWKNQVQILESSSNVIIIYGDSDSLLSLIVNIKQKLLTWKVWVLISQWDVSKFDDYFMVDSLHGALIFSHHREEIPNFTDFMQKSNPSKYPEDTYLHVLWHIFFNCSFVKKDCKIVHNCLPNASLGFLPGNIFDMAMSEESYNVYNAVYAVAHSLHEMILNQVQFQPHEKGKKMVFFPWQLHPFLRKIQLINQYGCSVVLDYKRKSYVEYDILNFWNFPKGLGLNVKVGTFFPNAPKEQKLSISSNMIQWATGSTEVPRSVCSESCHPGFRKTYQEGRVVCCFDCTPCPENEISNETDMDQCVKCPQTHYANIEKTHCLQKTVTFLTYDDPLGKTLCVISLSFSSLTAAVLGVFLKNRDTPIVKANNLALSYTLLITLMLCFLCPLLFIGRPSTASCILQQNIFGLLFTMALSTVLAKTITVVIAFKITAPETVRRWLLISRAPNLIIPLCTLLQIFLSGIWLTTSPPFIDKDVHSEHGHIIIICNKGSAVAFHCSLGYLGALALGSYFMAFLSRNLPDTFNEAKFLAFSMLVFCSVWITFLPIYHSTKGKTTVAMEVFSILASGTSLLGIIFAPKCHIILLRSEKNSLQYIKDKTHARRKTP
ncbi:vomeronasal 2 receptor 24 precursor [Rattus norvegicus]|uniref:Vomeronasal 2 receptor, 24 n=3 Tax=Rattus norvegicus TaxID=10116 RepID=A0ABK0LA10_RAT|nr:vomeronasal 2 receptor 24 precursor [Rattus norvegicus]|eukprot:NP_001092963.1 vomeronasal 2 receptor 24 precursor [Rattus norvegicus]